MSLQKDCEHIAAKFAVIQIKYRELEDAYRAFCRKKQELAVLLMPHDPDEDGGESAGAAPTPYPSEEEKARIREVISEVSDADLATMIRNSKPDLGALGDEMRMVFISRTAFDEAARRLEEKKGKNDGIKQ